MRWGKEPHRDYCHNWKQPDEHHHSVYEEAIACPDDRYRKWEREPHEEVPLQSHQKAVEPR